MPILEGYSVNVVLIITWCGASFFRNKFNRLSGPVLQKIASTKHAAAKTNMQVTGPTLSSRADVDLRFVGSGQ